jgi:uncharacterized cupredoxin-like copper-binding protein
MPMIQQWPTRCRKARRRGTLRFCWAVVALFFSAAPISAQQVDWGQAETLDVIATDYRFEPNHLALHRGQPYRLHFVNHGTELHEFNAAAMFKQSVIRNPEALNRDKTELQVQPGQEKDLYFLPQQSGAFPLTCPDHDWAGMTGEITVQ